jgi:hypothetical protein
MYFNKGDGDDAQRDLMAFTDLLGGFAESRCWCILDRFIGLSASHSKV